MEDPTHTTQPSTDELLELLAQLGELSGAPVREDAPHFAIADVFFENSWREAEEGLLKKTRRLRVEPATLPAPRSFRFELDVPYLRHTRTGGPVEVAEGPLTGNICYRGDLMVSPPDEPVVQVRCDDGCWVHSNYSRRHKVFCLGTLPPGPLGLSSLLELFYVFATYQSYAIADPADLEAAHIFATNPRVLEGLGDPAPLY